MLFGTFNLLAQQKTVTGVVKDKDNSQPLIGVTVGVKGNNNRSTVTDTAGRFSILVPSNESVLKFSFVGYDYQELTVGSKSFLDVSFAKDNKSMEDVVVVGYGTQKRTQITGAVATIKASEIADIPAPNMAGALRGRIAGLGVNATSGRPGAGIKLNVRNSDASETAESLGATDEPLYVIDGITVGRQEFDNLDPSMVEDLTVLKDASAAIYGAAGAKGVILVTTKRGKAGKMSLTYNGYLGQSDATKTPDMLSAYDHAVLLNDGYRINSATQNSFFSEADLKYLQGLNYSSWFNELWQPSVTQRHNLGISGGSDKITFFAGGAYQNENGNYAGIKQDKYTFRSGFNATITSSLKADVSFNVDHTIKKSKNENDERDQAFLERIIQIPNWVPVRVDDKLVNFNGINIHPIGITESGFYQNSKSQGYRINASLTYQPVALKGFTARVQFSQTGSNTDGSQYRPNYRVYNFKRMGNNSQLYSTVPDTNVNTGRTYIDAVAPGNIIVSPSLGKSSSYQGFVTLQYARTFGKHSVSALAGGEQTVSNAENLGVRWANQLLTGIDDYWAFDQSSLLLGPNGRSINQSKKRSFFGRASYHFDDKYLIDGVVRVDASSNFAKGNIWGVFPSVGLGWVVSRENFFMDNVNFINYLKLRFSYGLTGDDRILERLWQERFTVDLSGYLYNESLQAGLIPQRIPNPDITWEKKKTANFGIEMALLNNRLNVGVDVFQNYIYDAFDRGNDQNFPMYAGFGAPVVNYQERYAWGSEFTLGYKARLMKDLALNTSVNFSFSNSVTDRMFYNRFQLWENSLPDWQASLGTDPRKYNSGNYGLINKGMFRTQEEVDAFLAKNPTYTIDGKVPQPGWLYFEDTNGDGRITERDMGPMFENTNPWLSTGIQIGLTYKAISLSTNIAASFGGKVLYDSKAIDNPEPTVNVPAFWKDHWTPETPNAKFPRFDDASILRKWASTFWAVDGTTIRINNMTLSYRVPTSILKRIGMNDARILATGNNLWVLKNPLKYKDPYSANIFDYPTLRTISVGLSLGL
jgi:TonB-linked SusC/RagA family outer membrane protein